MHNYQSARMDYTDRIKQQLENSYSIDVATRELEQ